MVEKFLEAAKADLPVYITQVREAFSGMRADQSSAITLAVRLAADQTDEVFELKIPRLDINANIGSDICSDICSNKESDFVELYLRAEIYNIISALGGEYITFYIDTADQWLRGVLERLEGVFGADRPRPERRGFGKCLNVAERMAQSLSAGPRQGGFRFIVRAQSERPASFGAPPRPSRETRGGDVFERAYGGLEGKILCGIDIGGTDIKAVLAVDGRLSYIKEFDWFPALYQTADEVMAPIEDIVRLLCARTSFDRLPEAVRSAPPYPDLDVELAAAIAKSASAADIRRAAENGERLLAGALLRLDALGVCFPDVVVKDRIVGGETYKTRGIRDNPAVDYEEEFARFLTLNERLGRCAENVRIINDGPMASFAAAVEWTASGKDIDLSQGVFAHTLGTELGTGWVDGKGEIPEIPLEVYNWIIDLGSFAQKGFEPDDLRSINNFSTGLPGTLQKCVSQSGVFRLAIKYFSDNKRPDLIAEIEDRGFIRREKTRNGEGIFIETEKADMRKPFLEYLISLPDREHDPAIGDEEDAARRLWMDIGGYLAATWLETEYILRPAAKPRVLFGRMIKNNTCFELMKKGADKIRPGLEFLAADNSMSYSPLMKQLSDNPNYTVAQFAQAVGCVYFGNLSL